MRPPHETAPQPDFPEDDAVDGEPPLALGERIHELADEYLEGLRAGRAPDRTALSAAHPEIAPWLARRLALVELLYSVSQDG